MTTSDWIQLCIAIPAVGAFLASFIYGVYKFVVIINLILHEFRPNQGNSLRDRVDHLDLITTDQTERLERIENKLDTKT